MSTSLSASLQPPGLVLAVKVNNLPPILYVPGQDDVASVPPGLKEFDDKVNSKKKAEDLDVSYLQPADEEALRQSVTRLALLQARRLSPWWESKQRDCSGLILFVYREALESRSTKQQQRLGVPGRLHLPAVSEYGTEPATPAYPSIWQVGMEDSGDPRYGAFADAETLVGFNSEKNPGHWIQPVTVTSWCTSSLSKTISPIIL